jgi:TetR/AcrR family transcriptional repressor of nem operon
VLEDGRVDDSLRFDGPAADGAQYIVGSLEGSMMMARSHGSTARFAAAARRLLAEFSA